VWLAGARAAWHLWLTIGIIGLLTAREIVMDVRDRRGDAAGRRVTLATQLGAERAMRIAVIVATASLVPCAIAVSPAAIAAGLWRGLAIVAAAAVVFLLVIPVLAVGRGDSARLRPAIQAYVLRSRLAMAGLPGLILLLALGS
jgi:4-hydroxybenzoate polyprenyltransferase